MGNSVSYNKKDFLGNDVDGYFLRLFKALDADSSGDLAPSEFKGFVAGKRLKEVFPKMKGGKEAHGYIKMLAQL